MAHGQLLVHQDSKVLFHKAALRSTALHCAEVPEVIPSKSKDFAFPFVELHDFPICPFL